MMTSLKASALSLPASPCWLASPLPPGPRLRFLGACCIRSVRIVHPGRAHNPPELSSHSLTEHKQDKDFYMGHEDNAYSAGHATAVRVCDFVEACDQFGVLTWLFHCSEA